MKLQFKLKIFPNKNKRMILENFCNIWKNLVNSYIDLYWKLPDWELKSKYPPKEFFLGNNKFEWYACLKAWQIVKATIKMKRKTKPFFKKNEFDFYDNLFSFCNFVTKEFDLWLKVYSGIPFRRILIPCKKYRRLNYWLNKGATFSKAIKFKKINGNWYVIVYLNYKPKERKQNTKIVGFDIDYRNGVADSIGKIWFNKEFENLRKRTKWRSYKNGINPLRQLFNRIAKEIINIYQCNFAFEKLNFKGKKGRSKKFRRDYKNVPYNHLIKRIETLTKLEGFQIVRVSSVYTSQTCPICGYISKENRSGDNFKCKKCRFEYHADVVAATNIAIRAGLRYGYQPVVAQAVAEEWRRQGIQPPVECLAVSTPLQSRQGVGLCTLNLSCFKDKTVPRRIPDFLS